ncbi:MAG: CDP-alcohol phosphatidyltransferase family protein, partial [Alistipes sp.]|nr:CDP-alcohol phosphatidyltransferase family protein [Alistipes sp.]
MRIRLFTVPNLLTLMNLLCGALAVAAAFMHDDLTLAFWLIVAGVAFDFMDGFFARMLHV